MQWHTWSTGALGQPFKALQAETSLNNWDSHLLWADATFLAGLYTALPSGGNPHNPIAVVFEATDAQYQTIKAANRLNLCGWASIGAPYYTAFVCPPDLVWLKNNVTRMRLGMTDKPKTRKFNRAPHTSLASGGMSSSSGQHDVVLGIIDHGIAFANRDFAIFSATGWTSRIECFWDQQFGYPAPPVAGALPAGLAPRAPASFGYGWEIDSSYINGALNWGVDDADIYCDPDSGGIKGILPYPAVRRSKAHGTHVLSLMAGRHAGADAASQLPIIAVQLPGQPYKDTSGQNLCVNILNAVEYIIDKAQGRKVVINISDGAYAGPHDGSSILEAALDNIITKLNGKVHIVTAAGNQFNEKVHWQDQVSKTKPSQIHWKVLPDDKTDSHLEIWFDSGVSASDLKDLSVTVETPSGNRSAAVALDQICYLSAAPGTIPSAAIFHYSAPPNAKNRSMIHIALAATRHRTASAQPDAEHGIWKIFLTNSGGKSLGFNAYIERDNPAMGDSGPHRQSQFIHPLYPRYERHPLLPAHIPDDTANPSPIKRMGSLNNIATAEKVVVAGGYVLKPKSIAPYSAAGSGRAGIWQNVDWVAVSDESNHTYGVMGAGTRSGTWFRMSGTSAAAPQVARKIANHLASTPPPIPPALAPLPIAIAGIPQRVGRGALS